MNFQDITGKQLGQAAITAGYTTIYTTPTTPATRTFLKTMDICNTTAGALGLYLHLVPSGGSAATTNAVYYNTSVAANTTLQWHSCHIMNSGDTIQIKGSGTGLTITASGAEAI